VLGSDGVFRPANRPQDVDRFLSPGQAVRAGLARSWRAIRVEAGVSEAEARATHENIPLALLGWVAGCTVVWSGLFMVGNFLYGRLPMATLLLGTFIVSGCGLIYVMNQLWSGQSAADNGVRAEKLQPTVAEK
jgi:hypothetical protein